MDDFSFVKMGERLSGHNEISTTFEAAPGQHVIVNSAEGMILLMIVNELRALRKQLLPSTAT